MVSYMSLWFKKFIVHGVRKIFYKNIHDLEKKLKGKHSDTVWRLTDLLIPSFIRTFILQKILSHYSVPGILPTIGNSIINKAKEGPCYQWAWSQPCQTNDSLLYFRIIQLYACLPRLKLPWIYLWREEE